MKTTLKQNLVVNVGRGPRNWCKFFSALFFMSSYVVAFADRLEWDTVPLKLDLEVGVERYVHFDSPIDVGVPDQLAEQLRVQIVGHVVYLTAVHKFDRQRFLFRSRDDGKVMVIDLRADTTPVGAEHVYVNDKDQSSTKPVKKPWTPAQLTQFAARTMYGPQRLRMSSGGLTKVSIPKKADSLFRDERLEIHPYRSWKTQQDVYVSVVVLVNRSDQAVELQPSMLRGKWVSATFHHYRLLSRTTDANITVLYLVSKQPFTQALDP